MPSFRRVAPLLSLLAFTACLQSAPTEYHTLRPMGPTPPATSPRNAPTVGLEVVSLPAAYERSEIVITGAGDVMGVTPTDAWIGPLDRLFTLAVAEDLAGHLGIDQVQLLPTRRLVDLDRLVEIDVVRLEATATGTVTLVMLWRVFDGREDMLDTGRIATTETFEPGDDVTAAVAAINRAVAQAAGALADAVRAS